MYLVNGVLAVFCYFLFILRITMQSCTLIFQTFFKKMSKKVRTVRLKQAEKPNKLIAQGIALGYNSMNTNVL